MVNKIKEISRILNWPDVIIWGSGICTGFSIVMGWMVFDVPTQWDQVISGFFAIIWGVLSIILFNYFLNSKK